MSEEYHQHLDGEAGDELKARLEMVQRRIAAKETERFWRRVLGDKEGRKQFWSVLDETDAFSIPFKMTPAGQHDHDATLIALAKSRYGFGLYRRMFVIATDLIVLMHQENDPDFQAEPKVAPNAQGEE